MPTQLAQSVTQVITGSDCKRQVNGPLACAITAGQNIVGNAGPGGPLHDLLLIQGNAPPFRAAEVVAAMNQVILFAQERAAASRIAPAAAAGFGALAFALGYEVVVNNFELNSQNYISAGDVATGTVQGTISQGPITSVSSSSASACPQNIICQASDCSGVPTTKTCATGTNSGCSCTNLGTISLYYQADQAFMTDQAVQLNSLISEAIATPDCTATSVPGKFRLGPLFQHCL